MTFEESDCTSNPSDVHKRRVYHLRNDECLVLQLLPQVSNDKLEMLCCCLLACKGHRLGLFGNAAGA